MARITSPTMTGGSRVSGEAVRRSSATGKSDPSMNATVRPVRHYTGGRGRRQAGLRINWGAPRHTCTRLLPRPSDTSGDHMPRRSLAIRPRPIFVLLGLALACGSGGDATSPNNPPAASNLPAELLGEWHYQQILDQSCDPDTGQCVPTADQSETVTLSANGHFDHVFVGESNFPPCNMEVL